jgi:hypothetical protein
MQVQEWDEEKSMKSRVPVWRKKPHWNWNLGNLVRRHHRMLTMAGASLVFFTFVVREGYRDIFKEFAGSFEAAERQYQLQKQLGDIQVELHKIRTLNALISDRVYARDVHLTVETALNNRIEIVLARLKYLLLSMNNTLGLLDKISVINRRTAAGRALPVLQEIQAQFKSVQEMNANRGPDLEHQLEKVEAKTDELEIKEDEEASNLLAREQAQKDGFEEAYIAYSVLGFILYAVGWALGLLGTWYGIEGTKAAA